MKKNRLFAAITAAALALSLAACGSAPASTASTGASASGSADGMRSMDQSLLSLYQSGAITRETALDHADFPEQLLRRMELSRR